MARGPTAREECHCDSALACAASVKRVESPCSYRTAEEVSIFTTKSGPSGKDDQIAVEETAVSNADRQALAWLDEYLSTPQTAEDRRWGREFRKFVTESRAAGNGSPRDEHGLA